MRNDITLTPLCEQIRSTPPELLEKKLREFHCSRDKDIEKFIREDALNWERSGMSRTYLYLGGRSKKVELISFISVGITSVDYTEVSRSRRRKVLHGKPGRDTQNNFPGMIIGQLARDDRYSAIDINGAKMVADAEGIIKSGRQFVGGMLIYLDCKKELVRFYEQSGYSLLTNAEPVRGLYKMFKALPVDFVVDAGRRAELPSRGQG